MSQRPRFTADACRDLEEIVGFIGARDPSAAIRLTDRLEATCWELARHPTLGQLRPELARSLRFFPVGNI